MTESNRITLGVSEFVAYLNQTLEVAYPFVEVVGELTNFKVSRNRWVYFDLQDEGASLRCFGTVYSLPGPLQDGMMVRIGGSPRVHPLYNMSFNFQHITPAGEGAIKQAAELLAAQLQKEGLFDAARKRPMPSPPQRITLLTAGSSAAYADFIKIANARWGGVQIEHYDVLVQGEQAPTHIIEALKNANEAATAPDVIVVIRGGGSASDLAAFNDERVVRAVASSRAPVLAAIGHENDVCLTELAADVRASTPSNAAELLLPDKKLELRHITSLQQQLNQNLVDSIRLKTVIAEALSEELRGGLGMVFAATKERVAQSEQLLVAYDPLRPLQHGYSIVQKHGRTVRSIEQVFKDDTIEIKFLDGSLQSQVTGKQKGGI